MNTNKKHLSEGVKKGLLFLGVVILLAGLGGGLFYWYEYLPSKIRKTCSWVKVAELAVPIQPAITRDDVLKSKQKYDECLQKDKNSIWNFNNCGALLKEERAEVPAVPAKEWYKEAKKAEYDFCIHSKGL